MKALEPFSKTDLSNAVHAFSFARKCEEILDEVAKDVGPEINKIFKKKSRLTSGHFSPTYESAYCSTRKFKYGVATRIYLSLDPSDGELGFCVSARISRKHMHSVNRHLKWEQYQSELYSWHPVRSSIEPAALVKQAIRDLQALKVALNNVKKR